MSSAPATKNDARPQHNERSEILDAVGSKWNKFSKQELSDLKTNDELVAQVAAKYGVETGAAQTDVDALMNGRSLTA